MKRVNAYSSVELVSQPKAILQKHAGVFLEAVAGSLDDLMLPAQRALVTCPP